MTVLEEQKVVEPVRLVPLTLRPVHNVQWTEDTIDNEHMNKRKSKGKYYLKVIFTRDPNTFLCHFLLYSLL